MRCFALRPRDDHCIDTREKKFHFPLREKAQLVISLRVGFTGQSFSFCTCTAALNSLSSKEVSATPSETMYSHSVRFQDKNGDVEAMRAS